MRKTYRINTVSIQPEKKAVKQDKETLYSKDKQKGYKDDECNKLLEKMQKHQQT